jgi:short subunit fatty acids transporter
MLPLNSVLSPDALVGDTVKGATHMHWRKGTWALVIFSVLMLIWLIAGIATAGGNAIDCGVSPRC